MNSLINYVREMLAKGYSEEQIRQTLANNNYPISMVDAAFKEVNKTSVSKTPPSQINVGSRVPQLVNYFKQYSAQGYGLEQLKSTLLNQGYSQQEVDQASNVAFNTSTVKHELHLPLATILGIILLLGVFFLGFSFINNHKAVEPTITPVVNSDNTYLLDVSASISGKKVFQGDKLTISTLIINMGSADKYDISLKYELFDEYGKKVFIDIPGVTKAISTTLEIDKTITIPDDFTLGKYKVKVTANYDNKVADSSVSFEVVNKQKSGSNTGSSSVDSEKNNVDDQTYFQPEIIVINDDSEKEQLVQDVVNLAKKGSSNEAETKCLSMKNDAMKDNCLSTLAVYDNKASHCEKIISVSEHDNCLMSIMIAKGYNDCDSFKTDEKKQLCQRLKDLSELKISSENTTVSDEYSTTNEPDINDFAS